MHKWELNIYFGYSPAHHESLDWQPSLFINIVGKDDVAMPGMNGEGGGVGSNSCAALLPAALASSAPVSFPQFIKSTLTRPPTLG
jgi:hypothetical protein